MTDHGKVHHEFTAQIVALKERIRELEATEEELKRTQETLQESTARYKFLAEKTTDIVWIRDLDLRTLYISPSIEKLLGFTPEERILQKMSEQVTPASLSVIDAVMAREYALEERGDADPDRSVTVELEDYHKDGSTRWGETIFSGIRNDRGEPTGIHGVTRDITDRKRAEDEKLGLERRLARAGKLESIGTLAGGIAHDFNNLLMGIQGNSSLMMMDLDSSHPHYQRLKHIDQSVASCYSINDQAQEIIDRGCNGFIQKPFQLQQLSQRVRELIDSDFIEVAAVLEKRQAGGT